MEKEEILKKSQNQYKKTDPYEKHASYKGSDIAFTVMLGLAIAIFIFQWICMKEPNYAIMAIVLVAGAVDNLVRYFMIKKPFRLIVGIIGGLLGITMLVFTILSTVGVM